MLWQVSHDAVVITWPDVFPLACTPLWQVAQPPVMPEWLKLAGNQALVLWQSSHVFELWMCVGVFPAACTPL